MATLQTKVHGTVSTSKVRSKAEAIEIRNRLLRELHDLGFTLAGSAPQLTMLVCPQHTEKGLSADADFCYIIATP